MSESFSERYVRARRAVIASQFANLNEMQRQAVLTTEGPLLILAGAGSGKTTVLINRVANLMRYGRGADSTELPAGACEADLAVLEAGPSPEALRLAALDPVEPWRILAITFTNKAADELKNRLESMLGPQALDVWASTFHSACVRILRRDADKIGYPASFSIYDTADSQSVVKRVLRELNLDEKQFPYKAVLSAISCAKDEGKDAAAYTAMAQASGDFRLKKIAQVYELYAKRLREAGAMDFDDLIFLTVRLLEEHEDVRTFYRRKFRYVLIDEYQDTNQLQYRLAALLTGEQGNICVVGDDDQSIYKFRGATIENILSFERQFAGARVIRLEQNYRSTGNILAAANAVISNNRERKGKTLWTAQGTGEKITLYQAFNEDDEADYVARVICNSKRPRREFAVLYRTNAQSRSIELALKRRRVAYRIFGGTRFFDRAEVKDLLAYLNVIANPTDETRLLRIVNEPPRGIGATSLEKIRAAAAEENIPLFEAMETASHRAGISAGKKMEEFCRMISELQEKVAQLPLDEFYDAVVERTGYAAALEAKGGDENAARIENIAELKSSIAKSMEENANLDLYSYLDEVALYTDMDTYDRDEDAAVMMTMHSAKGLEFPVVFIVGAEEGLFPSSLSIGESEEMEEERRLCYVAITRAKEKLYITCASQRMLYGRTSANLPSRFTDEIPSELLDLQGRAKKTASLWDDDGGFRAEEMPYQSSFGSGRSGTFSGSYGSGFSYRPARSSNRVTSYAERTGSTKKPRTAEPPKPKTDLGAAETPNFEAGDRITHKAFGPGKIEKLTKMGNDALVEVAFDSGTTKKFMLRIAAQYMTKKEE